MADKIGAVGGVGEGGQDKQLHKLVKKEIKEYQQEKKQGETQQAAGAGKPQDNFAKSDDLKDEEHDAVNEITNNVMQDLKKGAKGEEAGEGDESKRKEVESTVKEELNKGKEGKKGKGKEAGGVDGTTGASKKGG
jgi:hypothetical protein